MVTVADAPLARSPIAHVTMVVPEQLPWLAVDDRALRLPGRSSVTVTLVAAFGPLFVTRDRVGQVRPARDGSAESTFVIARSAGVTI